MLFWNVHLHKSHPENTQKSRGLRPRTPANAQQRSGTRRSRFALARSEAPLFQQLNSEDHPPPTICSRRVRRFQYLTLGIDHSGKLSEDLENDQKRVISRAGIHFWLFLIRFNYILSSFGIPTRKLTFLCDHFDHFQSVLMVFGHPLRGTTHSRSLSKL